MAQRLHRLCGVLLSLTIIIIAGSGGILVWRAEIDRVLAPHLHAVGEEKGRQSLDIIVRQAEEAAPGFFPRAVRLPAYSESGQALGPYAVLMLTRAAPAIDRKVIFIDGVTAGILGERDPDDVGFSPELAMQSLYKLHRLFVGADAPVAARYMIGAISLAWIALLVLGLLSAWSGRAGLGRRPDRRPGGRLHEVTGILAAPVMIVSIISGLYLTLPEMQQSGLLKRFGVSVGPSRADPLWSGLFPGDPSLSWEEALQQSLTALPARDGEGPETLLRPSLLTQDRQQGLLRVIFREQGWPVRLAATDASYIFIGLRDRHLSAWHVWSPAGTSSLVSPLGDRLMMTFYPVHTGGYGGLGGRVLMSLMAIAAIFLAVSGIRSSIRRTAVPGEARQEQPDTGERA